MDYITIGILIVAVLLWILVTGFAGLLLYIPKSMSELFRGKEILSILVGSVVFHLVPAVIMGLLWLLGFLAVLIFPGLRGIL